MSRTRALLALSLLALLAGCGGAPLPPPPVEVATVVLPTSSASAPPAETSAPAAAKPALPPDPPALTLPSPAACELSTARWRGRAATELRFRAEGPVFARVATGQARLAMPIGPAALGAGLELRADGLTLRGHVDRGAVALRPATMVIFSDLAVPHPFQILGWSSASPGNITATLDEIAGVTPAQPPFSATVPCDSLTLDVVVFETPPSSLGAKGKRRAVLRVGRPVALSITPTSPPAAQLQALDEQDGEVNVSEVSGARSRIFWDRRQALVFGWVASADLHAPKHAEVGFGTGSGSGGGFGRSVHPIDRLTCDVDVPVIAEAGGERMIVGSIAAGTVIDRMARHGDDTEVWVRTGSVQIVPGARLLARAALLEGCAPHPL